MVNSCYNGFPQLLVNLSFNYILIISKADSNVKAILAFLLEAHGRGSRQYYIHTLSTGREVVA